MGSSEFQSKLARHFHALGTPTKFIALAFVMVVGGVILFWVCNQIVYWYLAKSYSDELADAYNLNRGFSSALLWASFAAVVGLSGLTFSFSKRKRYAGYAGLLTLLIGHSIVLGMADKNFRTSGQAEKCYVLTRDNIKIMNRIGVDPETGRECRALTPAIAEKIDLYKTGKRPALIASNDHTFFSPLSGEPVAWFAANSAGAIEMFDLMGYHPQSGVELSAVTRDVVEAWKLQRERVVKRVPKSVDVDKYPPFDALTGVAQVWYWRSEKGDYEFYDGPGYHPRAGDALQPITREVLSKWRAAVEDAATAKRAAQEMAEADARARAEKERQEASARAEKERQESIARVQEEQRIRDAQAAVLRAKQQAGNDCDRLAANPTDSRRTTDGVPFEQLKGTADQALDVCARAAQLFPDEQRYLYQLGRATQFKDRKRAFEIFSTLVSQRYPAAYDNLGGMYLYDKKDTSSAIKIFAQGVALGDADSMVSLADLVDKGVYAQQNPYETKWSLLGKAADLNHSGAQRAVASERARISSAQMEQENARRAAEIFGTIVGGMIRR
jgi:hypothetical protein